eukprot:jgi/Tetstr1/462252/TSEL_000650.t1
MVVQRHLSRAIRLRDFVALALGFLRTGVGDLTLETSGLRPSDLTPAGWGEGGGAACDFIIDFACVSSTTPTWGNDPRWCTPGIAATEVEHNKPAADRASSAPEHSVHR